MNNTSAISLWADDCQALSNLQIMKKIYVFVFVFVFAIRFVGGLLWCKKYPKQRIVTSWTVLTMILVTITWSPILAGYKKIFYSENLSKTYNHRIGMFNVDRTVPYGYDVNSFIFQMKKWKLSKVKWFAPLLFNGSSRTQTKESWNLINFIFHYAIFVGKSWFSYFQSSSKSVTSYLSGV